VNAVRDFPPCGGGYLGAGSAFVIVNSNNIFLFVDEGILTLINGTLIG
jgi:hypothetical protein